MYDLLYIYTRASNRQTHLIGPVQQLTPVFKTGAAKSAPKIASKFGMIGRFRNWTMQLEFGRARF